MNFNQMEQNPKENNSIPILDDDDNDDTDADDDDDDDETTAAFITGQTTYE